MKKKPYFQKDYPDSAYKLLFTLEDRHFWFQGRNHIIRSAIRATYLHPVAGKFLEVGCGTGIVLSMLERIGFKVTGLDMHKEGLRYARQRTGAKLICSNVEEYHTKELYDAIGAFDVIEHVGDDRAFIKQCAKLLAPRGSLYITVPAGMELWNEIDRISGHKRRYDKFQLTRLLEDEGFDVVYVSYFGFLHYIPYRLARLFYVRPGESTDKSVAEVLAPMLKPPPRFINWLLLWSMHLDELLSRVLTLPFGTSLIIVAKKMTGTMPSRHLEINS